MVLNLADRSAPPLEAARPKNPPHKMKQQQQPSPGGGGILMRKIFRRNSKELSSSGRASPSESDQQPTHVRSHSAPGVGVPGTPPTPSTGRKTLRLFPSLPLHKSKNSREVEQQQQQQDSSRPRLLIPSQHSATTSTYHHNNNNSNRGLPTIVLEGHLNDVTPTAAQHGNLDSEGVTPRAGGRGGFTTTVHTSFNNKNSMGHIVSLPNMHTNNSANVNQSKNSNVNTLADSSPSRASLFQWQDEMEALQMRRKMEEKQELKTRDGFCRRVSAYDGVVIEVEGSGAAYELGNYLGGGVAGVVYEGHRLRPMEEYPVRLGRGDSFSSLARLYQRENSLTAGGGGPPIVVIQPQLQQPVNNTGMQNFLCSTTTNTLEADIIARTVDESMRDRVASVLTDDGNMSLSDQQQYAPRLLVPPPATTNNNANNNTNSRAFLRDQETALEATVSKDRNGEQAILIDTVDAPSRSKHYARASCEFPSDASLQGAMEETVAIKVLNPVGFRLLAPEFTNTAVVARAGDPLPPAVFKGDAPMEERHVWWLINPNSRNLRTLQRYSADAGNNVNGGSNGMNGGSSSRRVEVDRGSPQRGLRISLIAAYQDEKGILRELPLTRCIEIWGHVPFGASDDEFKNILSAIDRINQGMSPAPVSSFAMDLSSDDPVPGRVGTGVTTDTTSYQSQPIGVGRCSSITMEGENSSIQNSGNARFSGHPMVAKRTGIFRAATTERKTVYCDELKAYLALPAVPSKYLKWLRQRRAATKEIRNMMLIGRHKNVVHLFEVLEYIQEAKSTMFLILELVRGGELFDLISSNSARMSSTDTIPRGFTENETVMRKFFRELASGVHYCHMNGIAHRDLKPENLLVHNSRSGECTLKIADFGLSAAFGPNSASQTDLDTVVESLAPDASYAQSVLSHSDMSLTSPPPPNFVQQHQQPTPILSPMKERMDKLLLVGGSALSFLTCGAVMEDLLLCNPSSSGSAELDPGPAPLKRMTSVVGSPHYVAPEIISQNENRKNKKLDGYDGTRADVWSIGVICYAMLFRSLPFGEDLLRCPRYQSYKKWYDEVKKLNGRRSSIGAALDPIITDIDERDFLGPHWFFPSVSSPESRDLIVYMLNPDPDCRPTVQMVLHHPWLLKRA